MTTADPVFRYRQRSSEDLPRLSRLAYDESRRHCGACRDFHVMWPYLRALGVNGAGPEYNWPLHVEMLARAAAGKRDVRWFLAGSADAGLLAVADAAAARTGAATHAFTVIDLCGTPVALCRAHAASRGIDLDASVGDLSTYRPAVPFDVVLMHQFLYFIPPTDQPAFLRHAAGWLAPGGKLCLTVAIDVPGARALSARSTSMIAWREAAIREDAASGALALPEDIDTFIGRLRGMRSGRLPATGEPRPALRDYVGLVEEAGLAIDEVSRMPNEPGQIAPARDERWRTRYMIVAAAP